MSEDTGPPLKKRGKGRPKKSEIEAVKNRKGKIGRPVGEAGRMKELKARLLATGGDRILDTAIRIALEDGHPIQGTCLKMCMDRMLPISMFEKDAKGGRGQITINIVGTNDTQIISHNEEEEPYTIDMEVADGTEEYPEEVHKEREN